VLGAAPITREMFAAPELDEHMRQLIKSCRNADWDAKMFDTFGQYLDSEAPPSSLQDRKPTVAAPEQDAFAAMYRSAGEPFKRRVRMHLNAAAALASVAPPKPKKKKPKKKKPAASLPAPGAAPVSPLPAPAAPPSVLPTPAAPLPDWASRLIDLIEN
jgi:hypothetical protein